jgi:hypothetical protein
VSSLNPEHFLISSHSMPLVRKGVRTSSLWLILNCYLSSQVMFANLIFRFFWGVMNRFISLMFAQSHGYLDVSVWGTGHHLGSDH